MKHNILWGIILLVASLSFTAKAQKAVQGQFSVKGVLLDSLSNEGEPYSTIRISLKNNPAKPVKLAVTGADGRFDERLAVPGTYLIHFTSESLLYRRSSRYRQIVGMLIWVRF